MQRTRDYDLLHSLLAFACEDELSGRPDLAYSLMAAFNIVAEHHVPQQLRSEAFGLGARVTLEQADTQARALARSTERLDEKLRLLRISALLDCAREQLFEPLEDEP
jgi:hypothetical protein